MTRPSEYELTLPLAIKQGSTNGKAPRRGRPRKSIEVKDETSDDSNVMIPPEDSSSDEDPLITARRSKSKSQPTKKVLKAVAIPSTTPVTSTGPRRRVPSSQTPSTISSALSSTRDHSMEYDTAATSAVATPAEPSMKPRSSLTKSAFPSLHQSHTSSIMSLGKRKRAGVQDIDSDAQMAAALQAEEYNDPQPKPAKRRRAPKILDSDDDDDDDDSDLSDEVKDESPEIDRGIILKKSRPAARTSLPSRSARDSATKTIRNAASLQVDDSEEDSVSEFSELDLDDLEDSDEEADDADVAEPAPDAAETNTDQASITPAARRRRRRVGPGNATALATRMENLRRRRAEGLNWRVSQLAQALEAKIDHFQAARERAKLEKAHPEIKTMWDDLKNVPIIVPVQAKQPEAITRKLKSFQLEGLNWMMRQEKSRWGGGLLGDEMGMGKTIQAVSLIMSDYPAKDPSLVVVVRISYGESKYFLTVGKPPVALMQWQNEINEYTNGKLKVLIYHNTNPKVKNMKTNELKSYDVIMISYSGLESVYRKESKGWKRDGGLIKENSKIHAINYHRLILDEAHNIKSRTTGVAKACFALKADHKWCLSGTPVQNRIGEFFSLLRFLQIKPFACYFCKMCDCAELHWSQNEQKKCESCNHIGFQHVSIFNQELLNPITQQGDDELRREGLRKLRLVTDRIMLRRMKRDHTASMELPPKEVIIHNEFFGEIERDFSSSIMSNTTRTFDTYVSRGVMLNNYANIFGLIMQMRQVANHPDLILKKHSEGGQNVLVCCICDETAEEPIRSRCHHDFCRKCAKDYVRSFENDTPDCPRCHIVLAIDFDQPDIEQDEDHVKKNSIINRIKMEDWTSSTKIEMLVYDLYKLRSQKQTNKSIVFSQFTSMLQLVEWRLRRAGFKTVMLDGSMSPAQRQRSIEYFMNNTDVEVFLVSLKAGGVALNLTEASRVFIIDP